MAAPKLKVVNGKISVRVPLEIPWAGTLAELLADRETVLDAMRCARGILSGGVIAIETELTQAKIQAATDAAIAAANAEKSKQMFFLASVPEGDTP